MPSREEILETARLARLVLSPEEVGRMQRELDGILKHVDALRRHARSATAVEEPPHRTDLAVNIEASDSTAPLRPDVPGPDPLSMPPSYQAPDWRDGFYTVPRLPGHE